MGNATTKKCSGCGRELQLAEFVRDRRKPDGYGSACRECVAERVAAGRRGERRPRFDPRVWHAGCRRCGESERNIYSGKKCRHPGSIQGAIELHGRNRGTFIPEGHPDFPQMAPWSGGHA